LKWIIFNNLYLTHYLLSTMTSLLSKKIEDLDQVNLAHSIDTSSINVNKSIYCIELSYEEGEILRIGEDIQCEKQKLHLMMKKLSFINNLIQSNLKK